MITEKSQLIDDELKIFTRGIVIPKLKELQEKYLIKPTDTRLDHFESASLVSLIFLQRIAFLNKAIIKGLDECKLNENENDITN